MENKIEKKSNQTLGHQQHTSIIDLVFARKRNAQNKGMEGDQKTEDEVSGETVRGRVLNREEEGETVGQIR